MICVMWLTKTTGGFIMPWQKRNWERFEEAVRHRETGLSYQKIGTIMGGISGERIRQMIVAVKRRDEKQLTNDK